MSKRFYIIFVARESDGRLRKVPIPMHYAYIFLAAALVGAFTMAGMAGSYSRMLIKTASFNQVRSQREALRKDYAQLEKQAHQKDVQAAALGSLASQVSAIYGFHARHSKDIATAATAVVADSDGNAGFNQQAYAKSLDQFTELRTAALSGHLDSQFTYVPRAFGSSLRDPGMALGTPELWPITGHVTSSFGERLDPFNGEGAFHAGIDIAASYGTPVFAPADGVVMKAGPASGYGREIILNHGDGITTIYGHVSGYAVAAGQDVKQGQVIGYVGSAGRSTGPHLHYEVRVNNTPVNPHKYLRETLGQQQLAAAAVGHAVGAP